VSGCATLNMAYLIGGMKILAVNHTLDGSSGTAMKPDPAASVLHTKEHLDSAGFYRDVASRIPGY
jgi:hypothetical protein